MQDPNPYTTQVTNTASTTKFRGRRWFIVVAMIGFSGLLFTNRYYHTGRGVMACSLWQYYWMEVRNGFPSLLGGSVGVPKNAILETLAIHLGLSALLGLVVCGVRWIVLRFRRES